MMERTTEHARCNVTGGRGLGILRQKPDESGLTFSPAHTEMWFNYMCDMF